MRFDKDRSVALCTALATLLLAAFPWGAPVTASEEAQYVLAVTVYEGDVVLARPTLALEVNEAAEVDAALPSGDRIHYRALIHSCTDSDVDLEIGVSIGDSSYNPRLMVQIDKDAYVQVGNLSMNVAVTRLE